MEIERWRNECPVCKPTGRLLSKGLPTAQQLNTQLVCRITGEVMDENNPPYTLPNGQVYSLNALTTLKTKSRDGNTITCAFSGEKFPFEQAKRVYII